MRIKVISQPPPVGRRALYAGYADGVVVMPADILAALAGHGIDGEVALGRAGALEGPLERMPEEEG